MRLIRITVSGISISADSNTELIANTVGDIYCSVKFSSDWGSLVKLLICTDGTVTRTILLTDSEPVSLPWETLCNPGAKYYIGVCGYVGTTIVKPTVYTYVGRVKQGVNTAAEPGTAPTPTQIQQIMDYAAQSAVSAASALDIAMSVRNDADNGAFTGVQGERGIQGVPGERGLQGLPGAKGDPGDTSSAEALAQAAAASASAAQAALSACAGALVVTESGNPLTIHNDSTGVPPLMVLISGKTTQAGSGTPSHDNVRAISGIGRCDKLITFDGTEPWQLNSYASSVGWGNVYLLIVNGAQGSRVPSSTHFIGTLWDHPIRDMTNIVAQATNVMSIKTNGTDSIQDFKAFLTAQYAIGTPVTAVCRTTDYGTAKTIYTTLEVIDADGMYHGYIVTLDSPLFDGDSVSIAADGTATITRTKGYIANYNGETVEGNFVSSTGGLDTGSQIVYEIGCPIVKMTSVERWPPDMTSVSYTLAAENVISCKYNKSLKVAFDQIAALIINT